MAARPVNGSLQQLRAVPPAGVEARGECGCLLQLEIVQLDTPADVEGRHVHVLNQIRGRGEAEQAECEALKLWLAVSAVVTGPDSGEELTRREWQASRHIDLVHKE